MPGFCFAGARPHIVRLKAIGASGTPVKSTEITETYKGIETTFGINPAGTVYID